MPRDPPVTRASRPSSVQKRAHAFESDSSSWSSVARLLTGIAFTLRSMRLTRPESTLPGPTSTNVRTPSRTSSDGGLREPDRRRQLIDEQRPHALRGLEPRGHGRHERRRRLAESHLLDRRAEPLGRVSDKRRVEGAGDAQLHGPPRALLLGARAALVDGRVLAGHDDLARAVVVRRPDAEDLAAQPFDHLVLEAEDRGHRPRPLLRRLGHRQAALAHEPDRLADVHRTGRGQRRELADRVADHEVGHEPALAQRGEHRQARRDERRLLQLRLDHVPRSACRSRACARSRPEASLPMSNTSIASGDASAISRPMPVSSEPWPGKQNAIFPPVMPPSPPSTPSLRTPTSGRHPSRSSARCPLC